MDNNDTLANKNRNNYFFNIELYAKSAQVTKDPTLKELLMRNILASAQEYFNVNHNA